MGQSSIFWDDLTRDLTDPRFRQEYVAESIRIATIDRIINDLEIAHKAAGLSKADPARREGRINRPSTNPADR